MLLLPLLASKDQQVLPELLSGAVVTVAAAAAAAVAGDAVAVVAVAVVIGNAVATVVVIVVFVTLKFESLCWVEYRFPVLSCVVYPQQQPSSLHPLITEPRLYQQTLDQSQQFSVLLKNPRSTKVLGRAIGTVF